MSSRNKQYLNTMNTKLTLSALFIVFQISISICQTQSETNFISGEVMVQLNSKQDLHELLNNYTIIGAK